MYIHEHKVETYKNYIKDHYPDVPFDEYKISVKNLRNLTPEQRKELKPYQIIIDRSSPLGNPFHMSRLPNGKLDETTRDDTIEKYRNYFYEMMKAFGRYGHGITYLASFARKALNAYSEEYPRKVSPAQLGYLFIRWMRYAFKILAKYRCLELWCWCAPKNCHAVVIIDYFLRNLRSLRRYSEKIRTASAKPTFDSVYNSFGGVYTLKDVFGNYISSSTTGVATSLSQVRVFESSDESDTPQADTEPREEVEPPEGEPTPVSTNDRLLEIIDRFRNRNNEDEDISE